MSTVSSPSAAVEVEIKGCLYAVEAIPAGEFGVSAVRLTKLVNGESYDVLREEDGHCSCSCPDYICRRADTRSHCKHAVAMMAHGLLPVELAPISGGSPAAVAPPAVHAPAPAQSPRPWTEVEFKRARYFGLNIPAHAYPAPAPAVVEAPAELVEEVLEQAPAGDDAGWDDTWIWTVSDPADLAEPAVEAPAPIDAWLVEATGQFLTGVALDLIEEDRLQEALDIFGTLEPENAAAFDAFLASLGSPVSTWAAWLDLCQAGSPVSFPEPAEVAPAPRRRAYVPTAEDWAEYCRWSRGLDAGCGSRELSPRERDLIVGTVTDREFREALQAAVEAEYDAARDCEECFA